MSSSLHPATVQKLLTDIRGILGQGFKQMCCKLDPSANINSPEVNSFLADDSEFASYGGHTFSFFKASGQDITISTTIGDIRIPPGQTVFNTPIYTELVFITGIIINAGGGLLRDIYTIAHKLY